MEAIKSIIGNATLSRDSNYYIIDFGVIIKGTKTEVQLEYDEQVKDVHLQATCGCTVLDGNKIEFLNTNQDGDFVKTIILSYTAEKENKTEQIKLKGRCQ